MNIGNHIHQYNVFSVWPITFTSILTTLILYSFYRKYFKTNNQKVNMKPIRNQYTVIVEGMTCQHCEANVVRNLSGIENMKMLLQINILIG